MDMTRPFVWTASKRDNFVYDCQQMRKRVEDLIPAPLKDREIKLGRGGLRDVEFTVQMLQLVHGRADETLRTSSTLESLQRLAEGGYVSRRQAKKLSWDYRFERVMEHRQQMWALKRTHLFPDLGKASLGGIERKRDTNDDELNHNLELRRLARAFHMHPEELVDKYDETRREVRHLHMDIYYRPMLPINAGLDDEQVELSANAMQERFASIGFSRPRRRHAPRHRTEPPASPVPRKSTASSCPPPSNGSAKGRTPTMGLLNWRKLEEHFGTDSEYLGFLRDSPSAAQRLCHVLSNSRFLGDALNKSVESVTWLGSDNDLQPRSRESLDVQTHASLERNVGSINDFANSIRAMRRHEIERIGLGWMRQASSSTKASLAGMTDVYDTAIDASLTWAHPPPNAGNGTRRSAGGNRRHRHGTLRRQGSELQLRRRRHHHLPAVR